MDRETRTERTGIRRDTQIIRETYRGRRTEGRWSDASRGTDVFVSPAQVQFSAKSGLTGLENLGNTCFVNSIVQCLSHTRALRDYCVRGDYEPETNPHSPTKGALAHAFALLLRELWSGGSVARPSSLLTQVQRHAPRFGGGSQHDAQEFLLFLLDGLHHDVNRSSPRAHPLIHDLDHLSDKEKSMKQWKSYLERDNSKIVDLFVGQLKSTLTCLHCGLHSTTFDAFWSLPLPVAKRPLSDPSLQECVRLFATEETLDGDERPHCPRCRRKRRSGKRLSLQRLPRLLVLFLKRFSEPAPHHPPPPSSLLLPTAPQPAPLVPLAGRAGDGGRGGRAGDGGSASKLTAPVNYPLRGLDLTAYTADGNACALYDLYAVSLHSGSMQCGHYVSLCRHAQSGSWYLYNDTSVTEVPESRVVSSDAYILFYELCGSNTHV
ncbi:ubiquitin carboxyl-terminal hydrolase 2-like [Lampetra fluviatilis]